MEPGFRFVSANPLSKLKNSPTHITTFTALNISVKTVEIND